MNILEKEIEDIICECLDKDVNLLKQRGLYLHPNYIRQLDLGSYGRADVVTFNRIAYNKTIEIDILELKKDLINESVLWQALGYAKGIERILDNDFDLSSHSIEIGINLIGKTIDLKTNFCYLTDFVTNINFYTYSADLEKGVIFERHRGFFGSNEMRGALTKTNKAYIKEKLFNSPALIREPF